jgi:hypothetical protein
VLHGDALRTGCAFARPAVADLGHVVEPLVRLWCITMLAELDLQRLQGCSQLIPFQPDAAQLRDQPQAFLAREQTAVMQPALEVR